MSEEFNKNIKKWLDGDFRRSDEAALRQSAKDDAFVRDAMDGFYSLPEDDHTERLAALRKKIRGSADVPMQAEKTKPKWWAMAAALVFLVGAVWFMQTSDLGENKAMSDMVEPTKTEAVEPPSNAEFSEKKEAAPIAPQVEAEPTQTQKEKARPQAKRKAQKPIPNPPQTAAAPPPTSNPNPIVSEPTPKKTKEETPVLATEPTNSDYQTVDVYDAIEADDAIVLEEMSEEKATQAPGKKEEAVAATKAKKKARTANEKVTTSEAQTTFDTDRELADFADSVYNSGAYANAMPPEPIPAGGWDDFRRYLRINARLTEEAMNNNVSGTVRVRFGINQMGEPINIVVIKSLGYGCDEEAKRLIEEGGEWQLGMKATVTVDVEFRR